MAARTKMKQSAGTRKTKPIGVLVYDEPPPEIYPNNVKTKNHQKKNQTTAHLFDFSPTNVHPDEPKLNNTHDPKQDDAHSFDLLETNDTKPTDPPKNGRQVEVESCDVYPNDDVKLKTPCKEKQIKEPLFDESQSCENNLIVIKINKNQKAKQVKVELPPPDNNLIDIKTKKPGNGEQLRVHLFEEPPHSDNNCSDLKTKPPWKAKEVGEHLLEESLSDNNSFGVNIENLQKINQIGVQLLDESPPFENNTSDIKTKKFRKTKQARRNLIEESPLIDDNHSDINITNPQESDESNSFVETPIYPIDIRKKNSQKSSSEEEILFPTSSNDVNLNSTRIKNSRRTKKDKGSSLPVSPNQDDYKDIKSTSSRKAKKFRAHLFDVSPTNSHDTKPTSSKKAKEARAHLFDESLTDVYPSDITTAPNGPLYDERVASEEELKLMEALKLKLESMRQLLAEGGHRETTQAKVPVHQELLINGHFLSGVLCFVLLLIIGVSFYAFQNLYFAILKKIS